MTQTDPETLRKLCERLDAAKTPEEWHEVWMKEWDRWRAEIVAGAGSHPRDCFEAMLDSWQEERAAIEALRLERDKLKDDLLEKQDALARIGAVCSKRGEEREAAEARLREIERDWTIADSTLREIEDVFRGDWSQEDSGNHYDMLRSIKERLDHLCYEHHPRRSRP